MITGTIFDIRKYSIHDGPGIRTAVFFKGCPLACRWCHNPEGRSYHPELIFRPARCILCDDCLGVCPEDAVTRLGDEIQIDRARCKVSGKCAEVCNAEALQVVGRTVTAEQVVAEIERDTVFYEQSGGGVTFTGGEPLAQPALPEGACCLPVATEACTPPWIPAVSPLGWSSTRSARLWTYSSLI